MYTLSPLFPDAMDAAFPAMVTVGVCMFSLALMDMVITSPTFARVAPLLLFEDMLIVGNVGVV